MSDKDRKDDAETKDSPEDVEAHTTTTTTETTPDVEGHTTTTTETTPDVEGHTTTTTTPGTTTTT